MPHSPETFLPPVINSTTGKEQTFLYAPQGREVAPKVPRYGTWEMTDLLVKQYPPVFHAATDVRAFVRAMSPMPNLRHLRIGQPPSHRYRRSIVDYALILLRMAVEQAPLSLLDRLSLISIHPGAVLYLQSTIGFGASPASRRRWHQIRHLTIQMTSFPHEVGPTDHLKLLHAYLQSFPTLRVLRFHWQGHKGLSPISLATEPWLQGRSGKRGAFYLQDINLRTGTWDEALAPFTQLSGSDQWKEAQKHESTINVPIVLSGAGINQKQLQRVLQAVDRPRDGLRGNGEDTGA
ncbi:hypothetical protein N7481_010013 [Penicillium waksmanii]|uniref:uncharacterized protein n=1 Tax=Penicillium waksmanii TaxID=69791 RepID=UPI0025486FED|nr:uncharacterized protein N7481_010013 [Penicillium waksmanii]KAJ5976306.1 hypothetical protein N7481_010013 [Penicillium waksmanii]